MNSKNNRNPAGRTKTLITMSAVAAVLGGWVMLSDADAREVVSDDAISMVPASMATTQSSLQVFAQVETTAAPTSTPAPTLTPRANPTSTAKTAPIATSTPQPALRPTTTPAPTQRATQAAPSTQLRRPVARSRSSR